MTRILMTRTIDRRQYDLLIVNYLKFDCLYCISLSYLYSFLALIIELIEFMDFIICHQIQNSNI